MRAQREEVLSGDAYDLQVDVSIRASPTLEVVILVGAARKPSEEACAKVTGENATSARGGSRHGWCLPRKHLLPTLIELRSIDGLAQMSGLWNLHWFLSTYLLA